MWATFMWERTGQKWISFKPNEKNNQKADFGQEKVRKLAWNQCGCIGTKQKIG